MVVIVILAPNTSPIIYNGDEQADSPVLPFSLQVDPADVVATTKEEEWVTKKKTELTTTRQIETRVQRQVVLEDGQVVEDSGPLVTTNTTEDTQKQEQETREHRTLDGEPAGPDWVVVQGPGGALVKEVTEKTVKTREEVEDRLETEDVLHLGDISDEAYQATVTRGEGLKEVTGDEIVVPGPRIVHASRKTRRVQDTDDCVAVSEVQPDGRVVTETRRTTEHEEERDDEQPDSGDENLSRSDHQETKKESSHRFTKTKDQDLVEYLADGVKIGEEMRYTAEHMEGEREGDPTVHPAHQAWDTLSSRIRRMRRHTAKTPGAGGVGAPGASPLDRKDALTRRPLDFDQEEETRKVETSKWLEHHFGSESRSSKDSVEEDDLPPAGRNTSFINVTMKSRPIAGRVVSPVNGITSTQVNGTLFPTPPHSKTPPSATFQRIASPVNGINGNSHSSSFNTSGYSSPTHGISRNGYNGVVKTSTVSSPVNGGASTPKSFVATVNSSSRVFVSTPENGDSPPPPPINGGAANGFFHGVSEWSERRQSHPSTPLHLQRHPDRVQVLPAGPDHTFKGRAPSPSSAQRHHRQLLETTKRSSPFRSPAYDRGEYRSPSPELARRSPHHFREHHDRPTSPYHGNGRHANGWAEHEEDGYRGYSSSSRGPGPGPQQEPDPDYSPPTQPRKECPEGESPHNTVNKKLYQRTRFAADIPPPAQHGPGQQPASSRRSKSPGNLIGDSFRKLVGKLRSSSAERKSKRAAAKAAKQRQRAAGASRSRSPSPGPTYQQFHVIDNNIPCAGGCGGGGGGGEGGPVAPPRPARAAAAAASHSRSADMDRPVVHKYYLGEDPFGGSIYGREKEYDGVTPVKRRSHRHRRGSHEEDDMNRANVSQVVTTSTLGRVTKSSSRLVGSSPDYTRVSQTLPRKLHHEERTSSTVTSRPAGINVSIVNNVTPAKPARTYRSNLSRSQSFNVHQTGAPRSSMYTSNPALNRLGESPAPLKSPAILASISRSQRDLTAAALDADETDTAPRFSRSTSNLLAGGSPTNVDPRKQLFMNGLADRAPELFKTLHGEDARQSPTSPTGAPHMYTTSTPVRTTRVVETTTHTSTSASPVRANGHTPTGSTLRNGLILDSRHSNGSASPVRTGRLLDASYSTGRYANTNGVRASNSFRSSSTSDSDPVRHLSSPYRPVVNGDRVTSPSLYASSTAALKGERLHSPLGYSTSLTTHSPVDGTTTSRSVVRRGSGDDYSETIHIKSKNDDPMRPSETNTIQSFSKKVVPVRGGAGRATEVVESSERTTVTKSSFRGGGLDSPGGYTSRNGGVVIPVRPSRK